MHSSPSRSHLVLVESAKVLTIFVAFYFLQTQIFEVRHDLFGSTSGLAHAQAEASTALGDTRDYVRGAIEDSSFELSRAERSLRDALGRLELERERLEATFEERTAALEDWLESEFAREGERIVELASETSRGLEEIERLRGSIAVDPTSMKEHMLYPTIQLRGRGTVGSGVLVYSQAQTGTGTPAEFTTFALTACHVVEEVVLGDLRPGLRIDEVRTFDQVDGNATSSYAARLVLFDKTRDIALLRIETKREFRHVARLSTREALRGLDVFSPVYAVGCPLGNRPLPTIGEVSSKRKVVGDQLFWMLSAPTFFGNSGGGVYRTPDFELIGVSSMIYTYDKRNPTVVPHMGLFVPLDAVYDWLEAQDLDFVSSGAPVPEDLRGSLVFGERDLGGSSVPPAHAEPVPTASRP